MSIHDGHRERLRESFRKDGLAGFDGIRSLELLLQFHTMCSDLSIHRNHYIPNYHKANLQ